MAYKSVNVGGISNKRKYIYKINALSGGISPYDNRNDGALKDMSNMVFENGRLMPAGALISATKVQGSFHSILDSEFEGNILVHIGSGIFRFDGSELHLLKDRVADTKSVFLSMNGKAYLYTKAHEIYEINGDLTCEAVGGYIPEITFSRDIMLKDFDVREPVNLLTRRVKCSYQVTKIDGIIYTLPYDVDENQEIVVYVGGVKDKSLNPIRTDKNKITMHGQASKDGDTVTIEFSVLDEDGTFAEYFEGIYGCEKAFCYGGTSHDGTRAFLTANDDRKGVYFKSELKDPLYFPDINKEILGDGSEKITAVQKRYEKLYFFTEKHIYAMHYEFSTEDGASFPVTEVYSPVGCDMKNTVRSVDNTPVFADRNSGIYILRSTDIFDELNVKHISANLKGVWNMDKGSEAVFCACDHDRKYYICHNGVCFVWDYGATPYYDDSDAARAESRLSWYKLCGFDGCIYIFSFGGKLYFVRSGEETEILQYDGQAQGEELSYFETKGYDLDLYGTKRLYYISFDCAVYGEGGSVQAKFFADGKEYYLQSFDIPPCDRRIKIKLPAYYADRFGVRFTFDKARVGIGSLCFCYLPTEREKFNF